MRLRTRLQDQLRARLSEHLPEAMATVWDTTSVVIAIEKLDFKPTGGTDGDWRHMAAFSGVVRAELRADNIDQLPIEALLSDLVKGPLHIPEADVAPGEITETARCVLKELRDTLTDQQVATGLRFEVSGLIVRRMAIGAVPTAVLTGAAPATGPGHAGDYRRLGQ